MPALLLLLHRRRNGLDLFARANLVSISPAVLLQRTQLVGPKTYRCGDRLHACRQRLCAHRRLAAGADVGRSALARRAAPHPRSLCQAVLSGVRCLRSVLPLQDCQEFRAEVGHDRKKGAQRCLDAKTLASPTLFSTSCWLAPIRRRFSTLTGCSTI